jgi:outer membrane protein OmpA-like peptidoglycan-associated protein/tetratricopeptide (TPR) repeat protein
MKKYTIIILCLLSFGVNTYLTAQVGRLEKANLKYDKYNYIDAREIYLKVVENGYRSAEIYRKLGDTYYFNSEYAGAAKWYYDLINQFPEEAQTTDYFRAAQCLKSINQLEESRILMDIYKQRGGKAKATSSYKNIADTIFKKGVHDKLFEIEKVSINTEYSDFGPAFYGDKIVFTSSDNSIQSFGDQSVDLSGWDNQPFLDLYQATLDEDLNLGNAEALKGEVNSSYHESTPVFTKDGKTMYFTRNNYLNGKKRRDKDHVVRLKIFKATKNGDSWGNIKELPFNDDSYSVGHPALNPEENRLYFSSDMPGTRGMSDIWYVKILGEDIYSKPINMGEVINTPVRETFPFVSKENHLYFSSDGHAGFGGLDIFITELHPGDGHGAILTLGEPINSPKDDFSFIIKDGRIGYFASNREGGLGSRSDDIYQIWERCQITIQGPITDEATGELISGVEVTLIDSKNNEVETIVLGPDAFYTFLLNCNEQYVLRAKKEGYIPKEEVIETPKNPKTIEMPVTLSLPMTLKLSDPCPPEDLGCRLTLQPIYFDFDKSDIRPDAEIELAKILAALEEYPTLKIHIESHTDSRGKDAYNLNLSQRRASSTMKWLLSKGVGSNRLSAKGYGETQLINKCSNNVQCTEEEHQLNRRSMFLIKE